MIESMYKQSFGIEIEMSGISRYAAACSGACHALTWRILAADMMRGP